MDDPRDTPESSPGDRLGQSRWYYFYFSPPTLSAGSLGAVRT
jgi:hypothetical protein